MNTFHFAIKNYIDVSGWYIMEKTKTTPPKPLLCWYNIIPGLVPSHWDLCRVRANPNAHLSGFFHFILRRIQQIGESELFDTVLKLELLVGSSVFWNPCSRTRHISRAALGTCPATQCSKLSCLCICLDGTQGMNKKHVKTNGNQVNREMSMLNCARVPLLKWIVLCFVRRWTKIDLRNNVFHAALNISDGNYIEHCKHRNQFCLQNFWQVPKKLPTAIIGSPFFLRPPALQVHKAPQRNMLSRFGIPCSCEPGLLAGKLAPSAKLSDCSRKPGNMLVLREEIGNAHCSERNTMAIPLARPRCLAFSCDIEGIDSPAEDRRPWPF